jgi:hypothetical protein
MKIIGKSSKLSMFVLFMLVPCVVLKAATACSQLVVPVSEGLPTPGSFDFHGLWACPDGSRTAYMRVTTFNGLTLRRRVALPGQSFAKARTASPDIIWLGMIETRVTSLWLISTGIQ